MDRYDHFFFLNPKRINRRTMIGVAICRCVGHIIWRGSGVWVGGWAAALFGRECVGQCGGVGVVV
eukprot:scaffold6475_cov155-Ochromonas_danica.AAC.5